MQQYRYRHGYTTGRPAQLAASLRGAPGINRMDGGDGNMLQAAWPHCTYDAQGLRLQLRAWSGQSVL